MLSPSALFDTWEAGRRRHPVDRAVLLMSLTADASPETLPDVPLGEMNRALMDLRRARFGDRLEVWADCTACNERMSLEIDAAGLPAPGAADGVEVAGHRFRRPTSRDLAMLAAAPDADTAARQLCLACAAEPDALPRGVALDALMDEAGTALDEADPWADLTLRAVCPTCGHEDGIALDVPGILWDEIAATAERLADEVHALASAYGWSERDILGMSEARRGAYLARVAP